MEKKEREYMPNKELEIRKIVFKKFKDKIQKVVFTTMNDIEITYKPLIVSKKVSEIDGVPMEEEVKELIPVGELGVRLDKVFQIQEVISIKQKCRIKLSYHIWNTEADGQPVTYRYIQEKQYKDLQILDTSDLPTESVE